MGFFHNTLTLLTLSFAATQASAATVAIVQPMQPTADVTEAVSRVHGELISVGLDVKMIAPPTAHNPDGSDPRAWVGRVAAEGGFDAVIDVIGDNSPIWVDVWVVERSPHRLELWRVAGEPSAPNSAERLAIRAIEVLRSSLLESGMSGKPRHARLIATPEGDEPPSPRRTVEAAPPEHVALGLGAALLASADGVGPSLLPMLEMAAALPSRLRLKGELVGFGTRPTLTNQAGKAQISEHYFLLGGSYALLSGETVSPFIALSAGALRTAVRGETNAPRLPHATSQWSFLLDSSLGVGWHLPGRLYMNLAGHLQWAQPYVAIHVGHEVLGTIGRPNLALTLTIGAWL